MIEIIELNIIDACNSKCIMCPRRLIYQTKKKMSIKLLKTICDDVNEAIEEGLIKKKPIFIIGMHGEPLLDNKLNDKLFLIKTRIPNAIIRLYTNAILIDKIQTGNIDKIIISNYGDNINDFNKITNVNINKTQFDKMKSGISKLKCVRIWNAWKDGKLHDFTTRAGLVKSVEIGEEVNGCSWDRHNKYLHILEDGKIILCCQDWKRETVIGDIKEKTLLSILKSERRKDMIDKVDGKKESDLLFICKRCRWRS